MLGVYQAIDPSTYSDVYPDNPNPRIQEIADLMTEWYQLFIDARYINAESVAFPPHNHIRIDTTQAAQLGLTKDAVDLYQMLPYHIGDTNWNFGTDAGEFLMWGGFLSDLRGSKSDWWQTACDPFYAIDDLSPRHRPGVRASDGDTRGWDDEDGPYMRPWYVTLTDCGNHGSIMVLDTKTYHMWFIEQLGGSSDPALRDQSRDDYPKLPNRNDLARYPSRPAVEFLRDMISRFRSLEWIAGGLYGHDQTDSDNGYYKEYKQLYKECGWPDKFNPLLFDTKRREGGKRFSYHASRPEPSDRERSYAALNHLYGVMAVARERVQMQIHAVDAEYRLERKMYNDNWEQGSLQSRKLSSEDYLSRPNWDEDNGALKNELEFRKADLEALRTRSGRYAGPGWAGVSDQEINQLYEKAVQDSRIRDLEALLQDKDIRSRDEREFREAKAAASKTPADAWENKARDDGKWENEDWKDRWSILGSGTNLVDVKTVLDEDMSLQELERRIVYELEKNEDRSWKGQRLWRNNEGKVAMVRNETRAWYQRLGMGFN
ncbi:hypothetical protein F4859DRAFT_476383 [Xylaria cf. heliscus]|nr:hypothetical protein F4859DRAFT_476383 [Xylaria cf. heliscus]